MRISFFGINVSITFGNVCPVHNTCETSANSLDFLKEVYRTFSKLLNLGDRWNLPISEIDPWKKEILAIGWIYIVEFAKETKTVDVLKNVKDEEDGFMQEMSTFTRAELIHETSSWVNPEKDAVSLN